MEQTRETFAGLADWEVVLWYLLIVAHAVVLGVGLTRLVLKYRRGRAVERAHVPGWQRLRAALREIATHSAIRRREGVSGLAHAFVFYGFVVLLAGTAILAFQDDVARPLFGFDFWHGWFYLGYSLVLDTFGAGLLAGLVVLALKRGLARPARLATSRADGRDAGQRRHLIGDWVFVGSLLFLTATGFLLETLRIAKDDPSFERWSPFGWLLGQGFQEAGIDAGVASWAHTTVWWLHGIVALSFVASIPYTKALHMLTGPAAVALRGGTADGRPPPLPGLTGHEEAGYGRITDLTWRELVQLDACTRCGRCHAACPATASGAPLSPRDLVGDLRALADDALAPRPGRAPTCDDDARVISLNRVTAATAWSCTQCMACVDVCPVGVEHAPLVVQLRRRLMEEAEVDGQLQSALEAIHASGNSFGEPRRKRGRWTKELPFTVKDIRKEPAEHLLFLGDYASYDPRNQRATQALARVLEHAGVDFGILYDAERNAGCDVRRAGEEGLHLALVEENVRTISACEFKRIVTRDPHSYHTLKNEYPEHGGAWDVLHHTELLLDLLDARALVPKLTLANVVTYHDPCMLGRYNGVFDAPRRILAHLGLEIREMPRNRRNSFCCGAGGGRIWMQDTHPTGARRPSEQRIDEAVALGSVDTFVVACPKDLAMYGDAIKTSGHEGRIELREIADLVLEALGLDDANPNALQPADSVDVERAR